MCASGNYKRVPDESAFIPAVTKAEQSQNQIIAEMMKLTQKPVMDQG